jgi:hypothetical protein
VDLELCVGLDAIFGRVHVTTNNRVGLWMMGRVLNLF